MAMGAHTPTWIKVFGLRPNPRSAPSELPEVDGAVTLAFRPARCLPGGGAPAPSERSLHARATARCGRLSLRIA
eukprot:7091765-Pyramimonas_sp.AAC.1